MEKGKGEKMSVKKQLVRREEDGLYLSDPEHWEMFDGTIYIHQSKNHRVAHLHFPIDIVRHLKLQHKQRVTIAIKHQAVEKPKRKPRISVSKGKRRWPRNAKDAIYYCTQECPEHKLGCAVDCELRKHFKIPPHGNKYPE